jgi:signal transduction histidine kinase
MVLAALRIICSLLLATGLLFTILDLRTRYDKSIRYFGLALIFLSLIAGIDLQIMPSLTAASDRLYWQRMLHIMACGFIPFSYTYLASITKSNAKRLVRFLAFASFCFSCLFFDSRMLVLKDGAVVGGPLYFALFFPYVLLYVGAAIYLISSRYRRSQASEKKILFFHIIGYSLLCVAGILDMAGVVNPAIHGFPSYKTLGILAFGITASLVFAERFMLLLKERDATFAKLESAYRDLEQVNVLKQLGESTAIINHEIKNYMFMISGNAQLLTEVEHLSQKGSEIVNNIVTSVERLTGFSDDILELSRTQIVKERTPVNLAELVKGLVQRLYPDRADRFHLVGCDKEHFLYGDWGKLEQVFINIFNNSFEAGAGNRVDIRVKLTSDRGLLMASVEDNGVGCDEGQLGKLFQAFYTTKKSAGGTGLGMSIARTIVESLGGRISAYSKNLARKGDHGLKLILTFPVYAQNLLEESRRKHPIVLIKDSMDNLADIIRVFQNVKVNPYVIQGAEDLNEEEFPPETMTLIVNAKTMAANFTKLAAYPRLFMVSHHERNLYILDHGKGNRPDAFSEDYVVNRILRRGVMRQRIREREAHHSPAA